MPIVDHRFFQVPLAPQVSLPLYCNAAMRIGLGTLLEEPPKFILGLFVGVLNRDTNP